MTPYDRDRLHELLQFIQEMRPKLDPDNPWAHACGKFEGHLTESLGRYIPECQPEPVMLGKKVRKLLVRDLCYAASTEVVEDRLLEVETTVALFDGLALLGQHAAFVREVELGVVWEKDHVEKLKGEVGRMISEAGKELTGAVIRREREPEEQKEVRRWEKALRRLDEVLHDCMRYLDEAKGMTAERVTVDA